MKLNINKTKTQKKTNNLTNFINIYETSKYVFFDYLDIIIGDPISSVCLSEKYVIIGTMMGRIKLFSLKTHNIICIGSTNLEHVSGISFNEENNLLFASIGDDQLLKYEINDNLDNNLSPSNKMDMYDNNFDHNYNCDNSYVLMAKNSLLKVVTFPHELEDIVKTDVYFKYTIIYFGSQNFDNSSKYNGKIKSTNFFVPLDFDGNNFCWVEYLNDKKDRNLCVQFINKDEIIDKINFKFKVDESYGHISHAKLLDVNKILIIRDLNKCEIRKINQNFDLLESFTHIGNEVYAVDIYFQESHTFCEDIDNKNTDIRKKALDSYVFNNDHIYTVLDDEKVIDVNKGYLKKYNLERNGHYKVSNSNEFKTDSLNLLKNMSKKIKSSGDALTIITLDIDGNVNKYENKKEETLFNLYNLKRINQDHKDKKFFDMGYIYCIKTDLNYFCIATDHGCFIIKRINNN